MPTTKLRPKVATGRMACVAIMVCMQLANAEEPARTVQTAERGAILIASYGNWNAYAAHRGRKFCFVQSKPFSTADRRTPNAERYLMVAPEGSAKALTEISVISARKFKRGARAYAQVGTKRVDLYTENDGAWVKNLDESGPLLAAMRRGGELIVAGTADDGSPILDRYSLNGVGQAIEDAERECR